MRQKLFLLLWLCLTIGSVVSQDFYDIEQVNDIRLYFTQTNWDQLLDNLYAAGNEERLVGTALINGVFYDSVGVRYKGNSSYNPNRQKNPFNIKLNHIINGQKIGPYGTLKLSNGFLDPTLVRETLAYEIARKYLPACLANYANVYVNDVLQGVYTNVQDVDDYFGEAHFYNGDNCRIKGEISSMTPWQIWGYVDNNPSSYMNNYELDSGVDMTSFINFLNIFNNNPTQLETVLNLDRHLWFLAFENCFVNLDSPINNGRNYYLIEDINNRFNPVLWDLNECFGVFTNLQTTGNLNLTAMQNLSPLVNSTHANYPILNKVLSVPLYKRMYIAHMRTLLQENITNNWYYTRAQQLQTICGPHVQTDPNYFFTYPNFLSNVTTGLPGGGVNPRPIAGITELMNARATYLLNSTHFSGVIPAVTEIGYSPQVVTPNSVLNVIATVTNGNAVFLGWRQNQTLPFQRVQMFDDGLNGDGAAGDGVFGATLSIGRGDIQYYIYAESSQQGIFYPARAEYEFLTIPVTYIPGEIFINEIQAKNASFADPFGQFDDWVELYNPNNYPVDIGGMYMTDNHYNNGIIAWTQIPVNVPQITTIPPNGYLVVWFDEDMDQGPLHINDKLSGSSDAVYLIDSDGVTIIDSYSWTETSGLNIDDVSIGRMPDGGTNWQLFGVGHANPCTPGYSNNHVGTEDELNPPDIPQVLYYPNPMRDFLYIDIPKASSAATVKVFNLKGQLLSEFTVETGAKNIWKGTDKNGKPLSSGIYLIQTNTENATVSAKICIIR